jgi:hypothetical protein
LDVLLVLLKDNEETQRMFVESEQVGTLIPAIRDGEIQAFELFAELLENGGADCLFGLENDIQGLVAGACRFVEANLYFCEFAGWRHGLMRRLLL